MYKGIFIHTVQPEDVGCGHSAPVGGATVRAGGYAMPLRLTNSNNPIYREHPMMFEPLGRVLKQDIGKQIWLQDGVYCIENQEQCAERLRKAVMVCE